jgi:hypothetical protein
MPVTLHRGPVLLPSMLDVGLPQQVDHYPGAGSAFPGDNGKIVFDSDRDGGDPDV